MTSMRKCTASANYRMQRTGRFAAALALGTLLALSASAQPLAWSPQRDASARPMRSLQSLAAASEQSAPRMSAGQQQGLLVRNPDTSNGKADFALADEYGRIQRYVEPSPGIDLNSHVGERVGVRSDTGITLLASQLVLTASQLPSVGPTDGGIALAQHQAPVASPSRSAQRVAQVQPIIADQFSVGGAPCNCPNCSVNHYGTPANGGYISGYDGCNSCQSCNSCQPAYISPPIGPSCRVGSRGRVYGRVEYLLWWFDGMHAPPLVTTSPAGTPQAQAGVLGQPGTTILYGGDEILNGSRDGLRLSLGTWLTDYQDIGIEGDLMFFGDDSSGFSRTGVNGVPILARPFFNMVPVDGAGAVLPPAEDAELVSFPGVVDGTVSVNTNSEFRGAGLRARAAICCKELGGGCHPCGSTGPWGVSRIDAIAGYRYLSLDERIIIRENLRSLLSTNPGNFDISDRFDTSNEFHGADIGFIWEWETAQWSLELLTKMAIGNTDQRVNIRGETTVSNNGASFTNDGGLLALRSNIGSYQRDVFTVIPELGVTAGYKITPRLKATIGYTMLFWSRVVRPGDHIDLDVNPNLLPPVIEPVVGPERPRFEWDDTALLAHGLNLGLDYRF